jgi:hypothetical protein
MKARTILFVFFFTVYISNSFAQADSSKTTGKVSHAYKKSGCSTVIVVDSQPCLILIPKAKLPKALDKDGMLISFNYRKLKMPNPKGCVKGIPAEISNASKKK